MNKRVHEIAKERGLTTKDVLAQLNAAGLDVKAASSSVDEEVAKRVLATGDAKPTTVPEAPRRAPAGHAPTPKTKSATKSAPEPDATKVQTSANAATTPTAQAPPAPVGAMTP